MARIPNEETNPEEDTFDPKSRKVFAAMPNWIRSGTKGDGAWNSFQQGPGMKITRNSVFGLCWQLLPQRHWESNKLTSGFGRLTTRIHSFNTFLDRVTLNKIDLKPPRALVSTIQIDWNFLLWREECPSDSGFFVLFCMLRFGCTSTECKMGALIFYRFVWE